ncbi:hypothetical protein VPNG_05499 [Cytospora leucostoma]|uniref:SnoaL-like domain-containing protein n=1 Tax=Cytospora leucostoma TaxID=1230097 RepID=A0A423XBK3_9PEZI|nr:hypothetical protein VPNG_05499 [Cytospora leucostoma]
MTAIDAQLADEVKAIKALIQSFFDAINAADTRALQSHFVPSADLTIIRQDPPLPHGTPISSSSSSSPGAGALATQVEDEEEERLTVVIRTTIEKFIKLLDDDKKRREGRPGPALHETPDLDATEVRVDALFAVAWSPFEVTFDGALHHYGTMVYTLGRVDDVGGGRKGWRVEGLTQNYRRTPGWPEGGGESLGVV